MRYFFLSCLLCGCTLFSQAQADIRPIALHLSQFEGTWELVPSSLEIVPAPPNLDTAMFSLRMECHLGQDSLSVHCSYSGSKEILQFKVRSLGQELMVYEPTAEVIYKLSGIRNLSEQAELNGMFVTIGKGVFEKGGKLELTEYLAGQAGPVGLHTYQWTSPLAFIESSTYTDENGREMRRSSWVMRRLRPSSNK